MTGARNAVSMGVEAACCCSKAEALRPAEPSTFNCVGKLARPSPHSLLAARSSAKRRVKERFVLRFRLPALVGSTSLLLRPDCAGAMANRPPSTLQLHAISNSAADESEATIDARVWGTETSTSNSAEDEAQPGLTVRSVEDSMLAGVSDTLVQRKPASEPTTEQSPSSSGAPRNADSSTSSIAGPMWVRDSRGVLRRAGYQAPRSPRANKGVQKASPSQRRLPRHGPQRAAAVVQMFYDCNLTTEAVLDQLAAALQKAELNMVIKDLGKKGRANKAMQVFEWMLQQENERHTPDEITFTSMITVLRKHAQMQKAMELFEMMEKVGCQRNAYIYNALLSGYAKSGAAQEALQLFERMKGEGIQPDESSYNVLINACGRGRQLLQAMALFQEMQGKGLQPSAVTYTTLVGAFGKHNRPYQALRTFQEALEAGVSADRPLFNSLLDALARGNLYSEMGKVHRKMAAQGFAPSLDAYYSMLASYKRGGRSSEARAVLDEMLKAGLDPGPVSLPDMQSYGNKVQRTRP